MSGPGAGRTSGRARGRAGNPPPGNNSPGGSSGSGSGSERTSSRGGNGNGNGNGNGAAAVRGAAAIRGRLLNTRPEGRESKAVGGPGQEVQVFANYFKVVTPQDNLLWDYRIDFEPELELISSRRQIISSQKALFNDAYVYDGVSNLKAMNDIGEKAEINTVTQNGIHVKLTIKRTGNIKWYEQEMLRFLNTQLRRNFEHLKFLQIFRHYYDPNNRTPLPGRNLEIWHGLATAIARHDDGIMMCCDTVSKVVRSETVLEVMAEIRRRSPGDFSNELRRQLPGSVVMTSYNNKTYRISDVDFDKKPTSTFDRKGVLVTYINYFQQQYQQSINDPNQPLLVVNPSEREKRFAEQRGREAKAIYLVPELCLMTGLSEAHRSDFNLKKEMTQSTQLDPNKRFASLRSFRQRLGENEQVKTDMDKWRLSYSTMPVALTARVLPPEKVIMSGGQELSFNPEKADFSAEMRGKKMFDVSTTANDVRDWLILYGRRNEGDIQEFANTLKKVASPLGLIFSARPRSEMIPDDRPSGFQNALSQKTGAAQLVVCIVPNNDKSRYDTIKKFCYIEKGVASQVVVGRTLAKKQQLMSVCTKIAIQMATKLGCSPWSFKIPPRGLMVLGFDTYHDGARRGESVGALVASLDQPLTKYYSRVGYHSAGKMQELSTCIAGMFRGALLEYRKVNGQLPSTIYFYRDGVGDGQINHVFEIEVKEIGKIIDELRGDQDIKFVFCIVSKRINTRFLKQLQRPNLGNPSPGTIVDHTVTRPERFEFFCVSQSVRAGTVSPTNYNIICDTSTFKAQNHQMLAYKMTHLYFNWQGTIRVPAPCQYAHKLAFLTGQSLHREPSTLMGNTLFYL